MDRQLGLFFLVIFLTISLGFTQIPQKLSYQGILTDAGGVAVPNGDYDLHFALYTAASGGAAQWTENQTVTVTNGVFNALLGDVTPLTLDFNLPYWLGIIVGTGSELTPRIELTASAYSLNALTVMDTAITTEKLADEAVTQAKLAPGVSLPPGGAAGGDLTGTYPNPAIANNAVTTVKVVDGAITQAKLDPGVSLPPGGVAGGDLTGNYPNPFIADNAVSSAKIQDFQVTNADLATNSVSSEKLEDGDVNEVDLAPGSVSSAKIQASAVTTAKIADGAVTQAKLDPGVSLPPGGTAGGDLNGTYPNPSIATNAVNSAKIQDLTVTSTDLASNAVTTAKLTNVSVTTAKLADGSVTQPKLAAGITAIPSGAAGGDLGGTYPNPTVDGLQGRTVASTAPTSGQVLKWSGSNWSPSTDISGGTPSGTAGGDLAGTYPNPSVDGWRGRPLTSTTPLQGQVMKWTGSNWNPADDNTGSSFWAPSGNNIYNTNSGFVGIGTSSPLRPLHLNADSNGEIALFRNNTSPGRGVEISLAEMNAPIALKLSTTNAAGNSSGASLDFQGVRQGGLAVLAGRISGYITDMVNGNDAELTFYTRSGGLFEERMRIASNGRVSIGAPSPTGRLHVFTDDLYAGYFESNYGSSANHVIHAEFTSTFGVDATAIFGQSRPAAGYGYGGRFVGGYYGLTAFGDGGGYTGTVHGIYGSATGTAGVRYGVRGYASSSTINSQAYGLYGSAAGAYLSYGIYATTTGGEIRRAGYFSGNVDISGTLSKGGGSFKIDHPLDPENKYLYHSFVESPDMKNIYDGVVVLDSRGEAWIDLPEWFETLNMDFRYQLTCIGGYAPVYIAQEILGNRFKIAGGNPDLKVSWQVTGIRQDAFAQKNRIPVEELKRPDEQGKYLHPDAFGQPEERGVDYIHRQRLEENDKNDRGIK